MAGEVQVSLTREAKSKTLGHKSGDMKIVGYNITFTANQLVEPANDLGWFLLNGAVISQTIYPVLFARFGSHFNTGGEGVGNFRLPDFTDGKIPLPKGLTNFTTYAGTGGELTHTVTTGEMAAHSHDDTLGVSVSAHYHSVSVSGGATASGGAAHTHGSITELVTGTIGSQAGGVIQDLNYQTANDVTGSSSHSHGFSGSLANASSGGLTISGAITAAGGGGSHNNAQPYVVMGGWLVRYG